MANSSRSLGAAPADPSVPCVGIFWRVQTAVGPKLVSHVVSLDDAEEYGDYLTHPSGHYAVWESWKKAGGAILRSYGLPLEILSTEYEQHPRGRVVFDRRAAEFTIYADKRLQTPQIVQETAELFSISGKPYALRSDSHYTIGPVPLD